MTRSELREELISRTQFGRCEWPHCRDQGAEMAHIRPSGRGGDPKGLRDHLGNVVWLCKYHHDLLDGREKMNRWEWSSWIEAYVAKSGGGT